MSTPTTTCPTWCEQRDHETGACESRVLEAGRVSIWAQDTGVIWLDTLPSGSDLTPAQARKLAGHLLALAGDVEGSGVRT